jgi:hypothetical protein
MCANLWHGAGYFDGDISQIVILLPTAPLITETAHHFWPKLNGEFV